MGADLIANLRSLFCLVPLGDITRSPWSTRPEYLCRFAVRINTNLSIYVYLASKTHIDVLYSQNVETFLGSVLYKVESGCPSSSYGARSRY